MKRVLRSPSEIQADIDLVDQLQAKLQDELRISQKNEIKAERKFRYVKTPEFFKGDTVFIDNEITTPSNVIANRNDRLSIVREVKDGKVFIRTLNGFKTWRYPSNLSLALELVDDKASIGKRS